MANPIIQIGDDVREMTDEEYEQWVKDCDALTEQLAAIETQNAAQLEARKAPLRRLGLTEDEINTVLGL